METPDPLIGARLGEYQVVERIGEGGMGIVYRGFQPVIKKRVAIKVLRPEIASNPDHVRRLLEEARTVNAIGHRGIIDIYGFGEVPDGRHYLVMEYLEGQPLDQLLAERGAFYPLEAIPLLKEIGAALSAAHARGVIHRDLKPSNVYVVTQPDGTRFTKLLDFGLAKQGEGPPGGATPQTSESHIVGTAEYMAPEQARAEAVSPRTDLYALGVLAFELLTGQLPFRAATPIETVMQQLNLAPPAPSSLVDGIPPALDALVLELLAKEPAQRPPSADAVRAALVSIERELANANTRVVKSGEKRAVAAPGPRDDTTDTFEPPQRRRPRAVLAAALASGVAALGLVVGAVRVATRAPEPAPATRPPSSPAAAAPPIARVEPPAPVPVPAAPAPPEPPPVSLPPPSHPARVEAAAPSADDLRARVDRLERRLAARGDDADPTALPLLRKQRLDLTISRTPAARRKIEQNLDAWERQFLRR